jgi:hypothetical protein
MHTLFMIFLICWAFNIARSMINGKHKDPTAGRLTPTPNHAAVVASAQAAAHARKIQIAELDDARGSGLFESPEQMYRRTYAARESRGTNTRR